MALSPGEVYFTPLFQEVPLFHRLLIALLLLTGITLVLAAPTRDALAVSAEADSVAAKQPHFPSTPT